jgi:hypothetical protein
VLTCSAAMPWPMQSSVETIMAQEGRTNIGNFLQFCVTMCQEEKTRARDTPTAAAAATATKARPAAARSASSAGQARRQAATPLGEEDGDVFYDVWDGSGIEPIAVSSDGEEGQEDELVAWRPRRLEDELLACLESIRQSTSETVSLLASLNKSMAHMDASIHAIRAAVALEKGGAVVRQGASSHAWTYTLCFGLAVTSSAAVFYMRSRQRAAAVA